MKRSYAEQDALIGELRAHSLTSEEKAVLVVMLRLEKRKAGREEATDLGLVCVGLMERVHEALGTRWVLSLTQQIFSLGEQTCLAEFFPY